MTINERLNTAINASGLSYGQLENMTGIYKSAIHRYATGFTAKIPLDRLEKLAAALNIPFEDLAGETLQYEANELFTKIMLLKPEDREIIETLVTRMLKR